MRKNDLLDPLDLHSESTKVLDYDRRLSTQELYLCISASFGKTHR